MRLANAVFAVAFATIISLGSAHAVCTNASVVGSYGAILYQVKDTRSTSSIILRTATGA